MGCQQSFWPIARLGRDLAFTVEELRFFQVLTEGRWWRRPGPGGVKSDAQVLKKPVQFVLLDESFGSFHLFMAAGTEFWVDRPGAQDQGSPLDPFARLGLFGQLLDLAFLFRIEMAQGVGEVARIGDLVLPGSRDVLHPISEEVVSVLPDLGNGPGRGEPDLPGCLHVGKMLEGKRCRNSLSRAGWSQNPRAK